MEPWTNKLPEEVARRLENCRTIKADLPALVNARWLRYKELGKDAEGFTKEDALVSVLELLDCNSCYRALLKEMLFVRPGDFFNTEHKRKIAKQYRKMFIQMDGMARPRDYKKMYGGLTAGDPKLRTLRAIYQDISCAYADYAKRFRKGGEANG